jgi:ESS family glutamate:Na+ symporter
MRTLLAVNVCVILGYALHAEIAAMGLTLPLFVPCLLVGIAVGNLLPALFPRLPPVRRTPALALVSDYALGVFLAISLMSLKLWALVELGPPLLAVLAVQAALAIAYVVFLLFPVLGGDYRAAVLGAGFGGFALGATPTAIANMTAVTKRHGPCPTAFVVLPLVAAFFVDVANTAVIQSFLLLGSR